MSSALKICPVCGTEYPASSRFCDRDGSALRAQGAGESDLVGSVVADRYHVMKKLGEGGMGQVYLVEHVKMQRKSALKVMSPHMVKDADAVSRFNREAANASRINHVNVASVYDFGETPDGLIFLAMEYVEGPSLTKLIEQHGALAPVRAAEIIRQASEALSVAHDMGIVHRDLKPDNIMIAKTRDGGDLVKVVDFGIAKAQDSNAQKVTKTGLVVGTPEYMSPEQLAGDKLDGRSDIYSLGLVAYNMLTGTLPFPSESAQESMIMRLTDRPKPLVEMKADISWPADVQAVMDKVLERDMNLRYQTAAEFGRELVKAVERMPATQMVAAGTMVMGAAAAGKAAANAPTAAIPATRVASAAEKSPVAASAPAVTPAAAPKSKTPMMVFAAAVVAAVAVGGYSLTKMLGSKGDANPAPPGANADSNKQATPGPAGPSTSPTAQTGGPAVSPTAGTNRGTTTGSGGGSAGSAPVNTDSELKRLIGLAEDFDETKARQALAGLQNLRGPFSIGQQLRYNYVKGLSLINTGKTEDGCAMLKALKADATGTEIENTVGQVLESKDCSKTP